MKLAGIWVGLVGCYSPTFQTGVPCETECPGDLVCIHHMCREPGYVPPDARIIFDSSVAIDAIDGPPGDADADTIPDGSDNCAGLANLDQHDEDGDQIGDVCDPCPHLSGSLADGDGDGVGDACDPQLTIGKQRIKFFDPFTSARPEWVDESNFTISGESLRGAGATAFARLSVPTGEIRIATGGTIASVSSATPHGMSLSFGFNSGGSYYHYGQFYDSSGNGGNVAITNASGGTYTTMASSPYPGAMPTGAWAMTIDESVAAQRITLAATLGGIVHTPLTVMTSTLTTSLEQTLFLRNIDIRYDYYLVIETLP